MNVMSKQLQFRDRQPFGDVHTMDSYMKSLIRSAADKVRNLAIIPLFSQGVMDQADTIPAIPSARCLGIAKHRDRSPEPQHYVLCDLCAARMKARVDDPSFRMPPTIYRCSRPSCNRRFEFNVGYYSRNLNKMSGLNYHQCACRRGACCLAFDLNAIPVWICPYCAELDSPLDSF